MKRRWWVAAPIAVLTMLLASSHLFVMTYLPWSWRKEHVISANGGSRIELPVQEIENPANLPRIAEVELRGLEQVGNGTVFGIDVPAGLDGWIMLTKWSAPTNSLLAGCQVWFVGSDGRKYSSIGALEQRVTGLRGWEIPDRYRLNSKCDARGFYGPRYRYQDGELEMGPTRPEEWENLTFVAMPRGVRPTEFHFAWSPPHYVTLKLPELKPFVVDYVVAGANEK